MCDRCEEICGCSCGSIEQIDVDLWGCFDCMHDLVPFSKEMKEVGF